MWRKIIPLLLALSIGMNIALLATWGLRGCAAESAGGCVGETDCLVLHEYLGADEGQKRILGELLERFHTKARPICLEVDARRAELIDLIAAVSPDSSAIAAKQAEIMAGQSRMQALVVDQLLAEKAVLDANQRETLFELLRNRPGCRLGSGVGSGWSSPTGSGPSVADRCGHDR
jgi:hypothetical protein